MGISSQQARRFATELRARQLLETAGRSQEEADASGKSKRAKRSGGDDE